MGAGFSASLSGFLTLPPVLDIASLLLKGQPSSELAVPHLRLGNRRERFVFQRRHNPGVQMRKLIWLALGLGAVELLKRQAAKRGISPSEIMASFATNGLAKLTSDGSGSSDPSSQQPST